MGMRLKTSWILCSSMYSVRYKVESIITAEIGNILTILTLICLWSSISIACVKNRALKSMDIVLLFMSMHFKCWIH
jgi:hypothetical protein